MTSHLWNVWSGLSGRSQGGIFQGEGEGGGREEKREMPHGGGRWTCWCRGIERNHPRASHAQRSPGLSCVGPPKIEAARPPPRRWLGKGVLYYVVLFTLVSRLLRRACSVRMRRARSTSGNLGARTMMMYLTGHEEHPRRDPLFRHARLGRVLRPGSASTSRFDDDMLYQSFQKEGYQ